MTNKPIRWMGDSRERLREFPEEARLDAGFALWAVQQGQQPNDFKPMPIKGSD